MEKVCGSKREAALLLRHLQSLLCTIIQKPHVISQRHLTEGTGASEAGIILQRSIGVQGVQGQSIAAVSQSRGLPPLVFRV